MPCKKKEQPPSTCKPTSRRILVSLPIKDLPQAILKSFPNSLKPSSSKSGVSDQDDYSQGASCTSHDQWQENKEPRPQSEAKVDLNCSPKCAGIKATALLNEIQQCRDTIEALAREAKAVSKFPDDCVCDKAEIRKKRVTINGKKTDCKNCCQKRFRKEKLAICDDCVRHKLEIKKRNKVHEAKKVESKYSTHSQRTLEKRTSDKNTCCIVPMVDIDCDCRVNEEMKTQSKTCCIKVKHEDSCNCSQEISGKKSSHKDFAPMDVAKSRLREEEMKKRNKAKKVNIAPCTKSCQKLCVRKTSDKETCCCFPVKVDDNCHCGGEMKKRNKVKSSHRKVFGKKTSDKHICCHFPSKVADGCDCDKDMNERNKVNNADSKTCCHKLCRKKTSDKETRCCFPSRVVTVCDCNEEMKEKNEGNYEKVNNKDSKTGCHKLCRKKTSDKETCCCFTSRDVDFSDRDEEIKKQSVKYKSPSTAKLSDSPTGTANTCTCRFPPAYNKNFNCTGQMSGYCQCDENNS